MRGVSALDVLLLKDYVFVHQSDTRAICDLVVVKLMPLFLGNSLRDLAILATCLMLPAERFCAEVVAGAGEAGGTGLMLEGGGRVMHSRHKGLSGLGRSKCSLGEHRKRGM